MSLLADLLHGETVFDNRWVDSHSKSQSLTFHSHGLPQECGSGSDNNDEVLVSVVSKGERTTIQVIGTRPTVFSTPCIFAIYSRTQDMDGFKMIASNLNRMPFGGHLYLEFSAEGAGQSLLGTSQHDSLNSLANHFTKYGSKYGPRYGIAALILMILCITTLILGLRLIMNKKKV